MAALSPCHVMKLFIKVYAVGAAATLMVDDSNPHPNTELKLFTVLSKFIGACMPSIFSHPEWYIPHRYSAM